MRHENSDTAHRNRALLMPAAPARPDAPHSLRRFTVRNSRALLLAIAGLLHVMGAPVRAENSIRIGYGEGAPGAQSIDVLVTARNDVPVHGYSLAVAFPSDVLQLVDFGICGTHMVDMDPEFVAPTLNNSLGTAQLGVIFEFESFTGTELLEPLAAGDAPRIIARMRFNVRPNARGGLYPIRLVDGIGRPASFNRFTNAGTSIVPELIDGSFLVSGGHVLLLEKKQVFCGASPQVQLRALAQFPDPLNGFSIGISFDCNKLSLNPDEVVLGLSVGRALGERVEFFLTDVDQIPGPLGCRSRTAVIFDYVKPLDPTQVLPASPSSPPSAELMRYTFRPLFGGVDCATEQSLDLLLEELETPGSLNNAFVVGDSSVTPRRVHGKVYFCTGTLTGRIIDAVTGLGVPGVNVVTDPDDVAVTTTSTGSFELLNLPPGTYGLRLSKSGFYSDLVRGLSVRCGPNSAGSLILYQKPGECAGGTSNFRRGFVNPDEHLDLSDALSIFNHLFRGAVAPTCLAGADANGDTRYDISDGIYLLRYLFQGGLPPPPPFKECGPNPEPDPANRLSCQFQPVCAGG